MLPNRNKRETTLYLKGYGPLIDILLTVLTGVTVQTSAIHRRLLIKYINVLFVGYIFYLETLVRIERVLLIVFQLLWSGGLL